MQNTIGQGKVDQCSSKRDDSGNWTRRAFSDGQEQGGVRLPDRRDNYAEKIVEPTLRAAISGVRIGSNGECPLPMPESW